MGQVPVRLFTADHLYDVIAGGRRTSYLVGPELLPPGEAVRREEPVEIGHAARHLRPARYARRQEGDAEEECRRTA